MSPIVGWSKNRTGVRSREYVLLMALANVVRPTESKPRSSRTVFGDTSPMLERQQVRGNVRQALLQPRAKAFAGAIGGGAMRLPGRL